MIVGLLYTINNNHYQSLLAILVHKFNNNLKIVRELLYTNDINNLKIKFNVYCNHKFR